MKWVTALLLTACAVAILAALSIARYQSHSAAEDDDALVDWKSAAPATDGPLDVKPAEVEPAAQTRRVALSGPFPTPDERYRDPYLAHPEFAEHIQVMSDAELASLADGGDGAAWHYLAGRVLRNGSPSDGIDMYYRAAEHGSVASLLRAGYELEQLANSNQGDPARAHVRDALAALIAAAVLGYSGGVGMAADTGDRNPEIGADTGTCEHAWALVDRIQYNRAQRGMPELTEVDRQVVLGAVQSYGVCVS